MATARNSLDKLTAGVSTRANLLTYFNSNLDIIDAALAKCNFVAAADPTGADDDGDGYAAGSLWFNTTGHKIFACEDASTGAALWRQIYPDAHVGDLVGPAGATDGAIPLYDGATGKLLKDSIYTPASFAVAAKGVTNGDSHDHNGGDGAAIVAAATSFSATAKVLGRKTASAGAGEECSITEILDLLGTAERGDILYRGASAWAFLPHGVSGQVLTTGGNGADPSWADAAGGVTFWTDVPGTPTRVSDSQFTITDTGNANLYNKIFTKGTVIKWEKAGGGFQCAMIKAAAYGADAVTIDILGNDLAADFTAMKYCIHRAEEEVFIVPGTMPGNTATTDIGKTIYAICDLLVFAAQVRYKTGPTTTKGVWDINDDATTIFTTKPEIAAAATQGVEQISDCILDTALTVVAKDSAITLDYDSGHATTPGADAYITIWWIPEAWRYLE